MNDMYSLGSDELSSNDLGVLLLEQATGLEYMKKQMKVSYLIHLKLHEDASKHLPAKKGYY